MRTPSVRVFFRGGGPIQAQDLRRQRESSTAPRPSLALTPRQGEIVECIASGMPDKQIAVRLGISQRTVRTHIERLFRTAGVHSRAQAVAVFLDTIRPAHAVTRVTDEV